MINLELAHFIAKFYMCAYFICFLLSFINKDNNKSNLILASIALFFCVIDQYLKMSLDFYYFYLGEAAGSLFCILLSLTIHLLLKVNHERTTLIVYSFYFLISIGYLVLHRVRVVIYDTDEPIMWLINSQSVFNLSLYFLSICVFAYGTKIKWNLYFGRVLP